MKKTEGGERSEAMRLVEHWLDYHHFHNEDVAEFKEIMKKFWETVLFAALVLMFLYTLIVVISPHLAFDLSRYFL